MDAHSGLSPCEGRVANLPGDLRSWAQALVLPHPWRPHLTSLGLSVLACRMGRVLLLTSFTGLTSEPSGLMGEKCIRQSRKLSGGRLISVILLPDSHPPWVEEPGEGVISCNPGRLPGGLLTARVPPTPTCPYPQITIFLEAGGPESSFGSGGRGRAWVKKAVTASHSFKHCAGMELMT